MCPAAHGRNVGGVLKREQTSGVRCTTGARACVFDTAAVEALVARGHRVSYITSPALCSTVTDAGAEAVELDWAPETSGLSDTEFTIEILLASLGGFLDAATAALPTLLERFRRHVPDAICSDSVVLGPLLAGVLDVPTVSLVSNFASNKHFSMAEIMPGSIPPTRDWSHTAPEWAHCSPTLASRPRPTRWAEPARNSIWCSAA